MTFRDARALEVIAARRCDEARNELELAVRVALWQAAHARSRALYAQETAHAPVL